MNDRQHMETPGEYNLRKINNMTPEELYQQAFSLWGSKAQIEIAIEEMAELIQVLVRFGRSRADASEDNVREEIADVEIMIEQLKLLFGASTINGIKISKLHRLRKRILKFIEGESLE